MKQNIDVRQTVTLKKNLFSVSTKKAERLGLSFPDYIRYLIVQDNERELTISEILPIKLEKSLKKAMKDVDLGRVKSIDSVDRFIDEIK